VDKRNFSEVCFVETEFVTLHPIMGTNRGLLSVQNMASLVKLKNNHVLTMTVS